MHESKDYIIRLVRRMVLFAARLTRLVDDKRYIEAGQLIDDELLDLTGLPEELLKQADGPLLRHMLSLHQYPEKVLAVSELYYQKGRVSDELGDPVEGRRLYLIADHCLQILTEPFAEKELQAQYIKLCKNLAFYLSS